MSLRGIQNVESSGCGRGRKAEECLHSSPPSSHVSSSALPVNVPLQDKADVAFFSFDVSFVIRVNE